MIRLLLRLSALFSLTVLLNAGEAQAQCPNNNTLYVDLSTSGAGDFQSTADIWAGEYATATVCTGATYVFSTCGASYDTEITLYSSAGVLLNYSDDACGTGSEIVWTADFDGQVRILLDQYPCSSNSTNTTLSVEQLTNCGGVGGCLNDNVYYTNLTPGGVGLTATNTCVFGGEYVEVNVCAGASYTFSACSSLEDTQITLYAGNGTSALAYNDDFCGLQSEVTWTADFTGVVRVLLDIYPCTSLEECQTLEVTQNTPCSGTGCEVTNVYVESLGCNGADNEINYSVEFTGACTVDVMHIWTEEFGWESVDLTGLGFGSMDPIGILLSISNTYYEFYFELSDGTLTETYWDITDDCSTGECVINAVTALPDGCLEGSNVVYYYVDYTGACTVDFMYIYTAETGEEMLDLTASGFASGDAIGILHNFNNTDYEYYFQLSDGTFTEVYFGTTGDCETGGCTDLTIDYTEGECADEGTGVLVPSGSIIPFYTGDCTVDGLYTSVNGGAFEYLDLTGFGFVSGEAIELLFNVADSDYDVYYLLSDGSESPLTSFTTGSCLSGESICDCAGTQLPIEALVWHGDGVLDDGTFEWEEGLFVDFNCETWGYDCGDGGGIVVDPYGTCEGNLPPGNGCVPQQCNEVDLVFVTDCYPEDNVVTVYNSSGLVVVTLSEVDFPEQNTEYALTMCLPSDCYTIEITDAFGDGLLGCEPAGYAGIFDLTLGDWVAFTDGSFTDYFSQDFCIGQEPICSNLDMLVGETPCLDDGSGLFAAKELTFLFDGSCIVNTIGIAVDGGAFDEIPVSDFAWTSGDVALLYNLEQSSSYSLYYVLDDGTVSPLFFFETGICSDDITICDCAGTSHTIGVLNWLGDGFADDGEFLWNGQPVDFNCATWGFDCGDVEGAPATDPYNVCGGSLPPNNGCSVEDVLGCTDPEALNYNPLATVNDGSCQYNTFEGCTDPGACNYNPLATVDDGSCQFITCAGCTNPEAINYDPAATIDDGSCVLECELPVMSFTTFCSGEDPDNFYVTITTTELGNGAPYAVTAGDGNGALISTTGVSVAGPFANNEVITLLVESIVFEGCTLESSALTADCNAGPVAGCTDVLATNFNPLATSDDGSCEYGFTICDCDLNAFSPATRFQLGNDVANDGSVAGQPNFNCEVWGFDCGDIAGAPNEDPNNVCDGALPPFNGCIDFVSEVVDGDIVLYPNPSSGVFSVRTTGVSGVLDLDVFDATGRKVASQRVIASEGSVHSLDLTALSSGSYVVQVRGARFVLNKVVQVQR